jgi:predicted MFS family arabinose efflux permease
VFRSVIGPIIVRLVPPGQGGRATAMVFIGNSLAIVPGVPLGTALGQLLGWRAAVGVSASAGAICVLTTVLVVLWPTVVPARISKADRDRAEAAALH